MDGPTMIMAMVAISVPSLSTRCSTCMGGLYPAEDPKLGGRTIGSLLLGPEPWRLGGGCLTIMT
jgi:hypothetical protein